MSHLQGVPCQSFNHIGTQKEKNLLFPRIKDALSRDYLVIVSGVNGSTSDNLGVEDGE